MTALQKQNARFGLLFDAIDQGVCVIEMKYGPDGQPVDFVFLQTNAAFTMQSGLHDAVGKSMRSFYPEHDQHWFDMYAKIAETGVPVRIELPAVAMGRWFDIYAFRIDEPEAHRVAVVFSDVTRRKADEELLMLLAREMDHRVQNTLCVVSSIIQLTEAETVAELRQSVLGRIGALSNSQQLLLRNDGKGAALQDVVEKELGGFRCKKDNSIAWSGPRVDLDPAIAKSIAMALHELATNACKHGALSKPGGVVSISWRWWDYETLEIKWTESGGPRVTRPTRRGLGSGVIAACVRQPGRTGEVNFNWRPEGLECVLKQQIREGETPFVLPERPQNSASTYTH